MMSKDTNGSVWSNGPGSIQNELATIYRKQYHFLLIHTKMTTNYSLLDFP